MARVAPVRDEKFKRARAERRREPLEAYAADAVHQVVCGDTPATAKGKPATKVLARVDLTALLRGYSVGDETCDLAGYGPVAVSALRDLIDTDRKIRDGWSLVEGRGKRALVPPEDPRHPGQHHGGRTDDGRAPPRSSAA